jgi:hypothetical protein
MPDTCPSSQLFGSGFGQNASTWNCGVLDVAPPAPCAWAGPTTNSAAATLSQRVIALIVSSRVC